MRRLLFLFACATAIMILLSACAASRLDADFGTSHKLAKINQVLNPDAERNLGPVYGLDGIAVQNIMDRYYDGFKEKKTPPNYIFSVGGIGEGQ
jgi:hypothetical protein